MTEYTTVSIPKELGERVEERGYDSIWLPEIWGDDAPFVGS